MVWNDRLEQLTEREFSQRYRLTKAMFTNLAELIRNMVESTRSMAGRSKPIPVELQLSMALRFLAGGSVYDIVDLHGVAYSSFYRCLWRTLIAIDAALPLSFNITSDTEMTASEQGFASLTNGVLRGIVGALDGLAVKIRKPTINDVPNPMDYWNRKGFFAVNVQAICDSNRVFRWFSASTCGSTHDATAFDATHLHQRLEGNELPDGFVIAGDEAYGLREYLVTPYSGSNLCSSKDAYNFYQSRCRINIECAFGMLVARWGVLWRKIDVALERVPLIIGVCLKLHNLCTVHALEIRSHISDARWGTAELNYLAPDGPFAYKQSLCATEVVRKRLRRSAVCKRDEMMHTLALAGLCRPAVRPRPELYGYQ
jgi:hypothetical protein